MKKTKRTPAGEALTNLMLDLFRLNSLLLASGDRLVAPLGLTSARWQILGAIVAQGRGHRLEREAPQPFRSPVDALVRLVVEQFVTFPRFVLRGGFAHAWRG